MSTSAGQPPLGLVIRGRRYPVVLPKARDPRLHLAAIIIGLQVLGQAGFDFRLSVAQILMSIGTCAAIELAIGLIRDEAFIWPASAMLTGNGIAFVLRVQGTQHGDWWSLHGAWIYCAAATVSMGSKYLIRWRGQHFFNPSNLGLVLCLLILGSSRVEPLNFWWGPMSVPLVLAVVIIVGGAFAILRRLHLLGLALAFWVTFGLALIPVAAAGHGITARWHLGVISGAGFWWLLVSSPEVLVFMFFMITDPKTIPCGARARIVYGAGVGALAALLVALAQTEFGAKVGVLSALAIVCAVRAVVLFAGSSDAWRWSIPSRAHGLVLGTVGVGLLVALLVALSTPAPIAAPRVSSSTLFRTGPWPSTPPASVPPYRVRPSPQIETTITTGMARAFARDLTVDLDKQTRALQTRSLLLLRVADAVLWESKLEGEISAAPDGQPMTVPLDHVTAYRFTLATRPGQGPPAIMATLIGTVVRATYAGQPPHEVAASAPRPLRQAFEIAKLDGHYRIVSDVLPPGFRP